MLDYTSRYAAELLTRRIDTVFRKWEPTLKWSKGAYILTIPARKSRSGRAEAWQGAPGGTLVALIMDIENDLANVASVEVIA